MMKLRPAKIEDRPNQYREMRMSSRLGSRFVGRPLSEPGDAVAGIGSVGAVATDMSSTSLGCRTGRRLTSYDALVAFPSRSRVAVVLSGTSLRDVAPGAAYRNSERSRE
jgi:hypothetical protein